MGSDVPQISESSFLPGFTCRAVEVLGELWHVAQRHVHPPRSGRVAGVGLKHFKSFKFHLLFGDTLSVILFAI